MNEICVITRESYIKARVIKIKSTQQCHIDETVKLANNGFSPTIQSHAPVPEGYQMFLQANADGQKICEKLIDAFLRLQTGNVIIERINC